MSHRILIVRFSSIGDIVLCSPVIRNIRRIHPNAYIAFATKKSFVGLLQNNPYLDDVISLEDSFETFKQQIQQKSFTHVIDLHNNLRSRRLTWGLKVNVARFNKLNFRKWLLVRFKINRMPAVHIVDRYLATAASLHVNNDYKGLDFFIPENTVLPALPAGAFLAMAIGGQHATKKMPVKQMILLLKELPLPVVLLGGKEDEAAAEEILTFFGNQDHNRIIHLCGKINLSQSALVVKHSIGLITHDTGMMHIGAALKKPVLSIWGNTVPEFGMFPYFPAEHPSENHSVQFEVKSLSCRPCSKIGFEKCPQGHFNCMMQQDIPAISQAALRLASGK